MCPVNVVSSVLFVDTNSDSNIIEIPDGLLKGKKVKLVTNDGYYHSFKGIPYAAPPIGHLRFREPQAAIPWEGIRDASEHGNECYQADLYTGGIRNGSEDCLFLNVYTQDIPPTELKPVLVYIHGGAFKSGSGNGDYYGVDFLVPLGIVVVTINYRLEVMGFLSLENDEVPGNAGMKDQVAALEWVQKNIKHFGGDATKVTIFGQSAGAGSVGHHLLSPLSKGLFHRAILNSGTPISDWAISTYPRDRAFKLGESLGFVGKNSTELLEFLRAQPKENLINKEFDAIPWESLSIITKRLSFSPVIENQADLDKNFLSKDPREYIQDGDIADVDIMLGYTDKEAAFFGVFMEQMLKLANIDDDFYLTRRQAQMVDRTKCPDLSKEIKEKYRADSTNEIDNVLHLIDYMSWSGFVYDILKFSELIASSRHGNTFLFRFSARTERNYNAERYSPECCKGLGTVHCDDLPYIFHQPVGNLPTDQSTEGFKLTKIISAMWANFIKFGNPTPDSSLGFEWQPYTPTSKHYLSIGNNISLGMNPDDEDFQFWDNINYKALHSCT